MSSFKDVHADLGTPAAPTADITTEPDEISDADDDWGAPSAQTDASEDLAGFENLAVDGQKNNQQSAAFDPTTLRAHEEFGFNFQTFGVHITDECTPEQAWEEMKSAVSAHEPNITKFKEAFVSYCKALYILEQPIDVASIEERLRAENSPVFLIALPRPLVPSYTVVGVDGTPGLTWTLTFQTSNAPHSAKLRNIWPSTEDNKIHLNSAGFSVASNAVICRNCSAVGHVRADCQTAIERKVMSVTCAYCHGDHYARDCTEPREIPKSRTSEPLTCRRCGEEGHIGKDCPEAVRVVTCRRCDQEGHMAKDCPEAPPPRTCRNCGAEGHIAKECPEESAKRPQRDFSKAPICKNCSQEGHSAIRCPQPPRQIQFVSVVSNENVAPSVKVVGPKEDVDDAW